MNTEQVINDVRFITSYPELVFDDSEIESAIDFTKKEIKGMMKDPDFDEFDTFFAERAVMWGTCYYLKIRTGEIAGMPMSIGDVNLESSIRSRGDPNGDLFSWVENFYKNFHRINNSPKGFGHVRTTREGRQYSSGNRTDYGGA